MKHRSLRRHEGYLLIDNRNSPGVSEAFVRASGTDAVAVGEGAVFESATVTCSHCHRIVVLNPARTRPRHYCAQCDHYVCDTPACAVECVPLAKVLDALQEHNFQLIR